ncbi:MAG TPA: DNA-processing protein DprA [Noviherbaspirillum sp.]|uniref:DNA-processing protein DprA n=1 Tax=Noviherbaspirillum sp. TaxID=1926288 RepID=UPI002B485DFD|nr:DNA-processing protein DprA [Noviherbaspirillum sp.]HJV87342.1 DNA-processing protein DprA [Noviherbaspirillum sp.]
MTQRDWAQELAQWIRLEQTAGVGPETARKLLAHFGLPENIFTAGFSVLRQVVSERVAQALLTPQSEELAALIDKTIAWAEQPGNRILTLADADYPKALLDIPDPPMMLYAKGRIDLLSQPSLAVVGSRNATTQGVLNAEKFSEVLSQAGLTIISGMALGIDTAAHQGSLRGPGSTVAVIGTGADIVYPARNRTLAHQIAAEGCIIYEYALGTPAIASNFPRRNRIISGLARGVLVIEAAAQSGSLITARMAADQGREVFAIPGSIHSPLSKGCHLLIKQGAKLVESAQDVLEEIRHHDRQPLPPPSAPAIVPATKPSPLLTAMGFDPVAPDVLATRCELDIANVNAQLLTLELEGLIEMLPGGTVRRVATS